MLSLHPLKGGGRILRGEFSLQGGFHFRGILTSGGILISQMRQFLSRKVKFEKEKTKYFKKGGTNKFFTSPKEPNNKINPRNQINPPLQGDGAPELKFPSPWKGVLPPPFESITLNKSYILFMPVVYKSQQRKSFDKNSGSLFLSWSIPIPVCLIICENKIHSFKSVKVKSSYVEVLFKIIREGFSDVWFLYIPFQIE